ncbi:HD domain-containing protein [Rubrivirga marina]|nr:HD domain-containing protein [Rubrivirga marina]
MTAAEVDAWGERCEAFVRQRMAGDPAHDLAHVRRVVAWAGRLAEAEGARLGVVVPAAWLHDVVTVAKDSPDRKRASRIAADEAARWLRAEGFPEADLPAVAHAVEAHSFSAGIEPQTVEAEVVQDADRLDALGAIGLARMYAMSAVFGSGIVHPDDPVPSEPPARALDDKRWATDHLFVKLLKLPATMRTEAGRAEAERRAAFLRDFLRQLATEVA